MIRLVFASCLVTTIVAHGPPFDVLSHENWNVLDTRTVCGHSPALEQDSDNDIAVRLLGADTAREHEFPWMAQLMLKNKIRELVCGGSLISKRYVLSAAHCVTYDRSKNIMPASKFSVRLGAHRVLNDCDGRDSCQEFNVEKIITHGDYFCFFFDENCLCMDDDVALIRLNEDVQFRTGVIMPICLPTSRDMIHQHFYGKKTVLAGFGQSNTGLSNEVVNSEYPQALQKLATNVMHPRLCKVPEWENSSQICTKLCNQAIGKGDSGGPLMFKDLLKNVYYQLGILSYGYSITGTNSRNQYVIYARVASYMKWILDNVKQ